MYSLICFLFLNFNLLLFRRMVPTQAIGVLEFAM